MVADSEAIAKIVESIVHISSGNVEPSNERDFTKVSGLATSSHTNMHVYFMLSKKDEQLR